MLSAQELRQKYLDFFKSKGHVIIPSASLIPENDPSSLFNTAGMQPLVPYLMGEKHPAGQRLVDVQKCIRLGDIEEIGDNRHNTFFEMLGNWSLGDYFKKESITWSWEFLTDPRWLGLDPQRIYVTVFKGEGNIPRDEEAIAVWQEVLKKSGVSAEVAKADEVINGDIRIVPLGLNDNFWIAGSNGPCGGDTEIFYDTRPQEGPLNGSYNDYVDDFRLLEIWNNVFMEFNKTVEGKIEHLSQKNVDTGMGMERTISVVNGFDNIFATELFQPIILEIAKLTDQKYETNLRAYRIIADHIKAATMILGDNNGITPSNVDRGYILRRLIRRAVRYGKLLGIKEIFTFKIAEAVIVMYQDIYPEVRKNKDFIINQLALEEEKFLETIEKAIPRSNKRIEIVKRIAEGKKEDSDKKWIEDDSKIAGNDILKKWLESDLSKPLSAYGVSASVAGTSSFALESTWGYPHDVFFDDIKTHDLDIVKDSKWYKLAEDEFLKAYLKHRDLSRTASAGMFKGGLADSSEQTTKLHTAAHLMLAALRQVLGPDVYQKGSNITAERLRFDFNYGQKMTPQQLEQVEKIVNEQISNKIPVISQEMTLEEAKKQGAMGVFEHKYGDKVKVYKIADFSQEICGGPHVQNTGLLGHFKIQKEESSSAGVRRIKAILQ